MGASSSDWSQFIPYVVVIAAIIAASAALIGIVATNIFKIVQDRSLREQRVQDIVIALFAEISAGVTTTEETSKPAVRTYNVSNSSTFATPDDTNFVFEAVLSDITLIPADLIADVIKYYRRQKQSNLMTMDLREEAFLALTAAQKAEFVTQLLEIQSSADIDGQRALQSLWDYGQSKPYRQHFKKIRPMA